jgi:hypothetical protein
MWPKRIAALDVADDTESARAVGRAGSECPEGYMPGRNAAGTIEMLASAEDDTHMLKLAGLDWALTGHRTKTTATEPGSPETNESAAESLKAMSLTAYAPGAAYSHLSCNGFSGTTDGAIDSEPTPLQVVLVGGTSRPADCGRHDTWGSLKLKTMRVRLLDVGELACRSSMNPRIERRAITVGFAMDVSAGS